jgi:hypothetical protein
MDRAEYVRQATALRDSTPKRVSIRTALPGGGRFYLRRLALSLTDLVGKLRELQPPPADATEIEVHFITPLERVAEFATEAAKTSSPWLSFAGAQRKVIDQGPQLNESDHAFLRAFGLEDVHV